MDIWNELFLWFLGLVTTGVLALLRGMKTKYDKLNVNVDTLMQDRAVLLEVRAQHVERSEHDRRAEAKADAIDFFYMDEQRRRGERRREWPK